MGAQHTRWSFPGNVFDELEFPCVVDADGCVIASVCDDGIDEDRQAAHCHLIAAAPDLLEALKPFAALLDALERMGGTAPKSGEWYTAVSGDAVRTITMEDFAIARAAIAKATTAHASDCAVHNAPALPVGPCDCGAS